MLTPFSTIAVLCVLRLPLLPCLSLPLVWQVQVLRRSTAWTGRVRDGQACPLEAARA